MDPTERATSRSGAFDTTELLRDPQTVRRYLELALSAPPSEVRASARTDYFFTAVDADGALLFAQEITGRSFADAWLSAYELVTHSGHRGARITGLVEQPS